MLSYFILLSTILSLLLLEDVVHILRSPVREFFRWLILDESMGDRGPLSYAFEIGTSRAHRKLSVGRCLDASHKSHESEKFCPGDTPCGRDSQRWPHEESRARGISTAQILFDYVVLSWTKEMTPSIPRAQETPH